jgi:hypothetical protein
MIRDRIDFTIQNLLIAKYEHMFANLLDYKSFCMRDDVFALVVMIHDAETEEQYLDKIKRLIAYVKLIAPEILELYELNNLLAVKRSMLNEYYYLEPARENIYKTRESLIKAVEDYR